MEIMHTAPAEIKPPEGLFTRLPSLLPDRTAQLVVTPHPLTTQGQVSVAVLMQDGETLLAVLQRHNVDSAWVVEVGGLQVPALMWSRTRVHHAQVIECRQTVQKDVVKLVAIAALAYFTMGAGVAWLAAATGLAVGSVGLAITGAIVFAAGSAIINKLLPPPKQAGMNLAANTTEPTYSLSGGRNQMRTWQPMSLVLGQPYVVPDLAGQPYSYFAGEDQYLVQQFHAGINCQSVASVRIGQTGIEDYQDVTLRGYGLPGNSYPTGLPSNSVDSIAGALLDAPSGNGAWVTRTTSVGTLKIGIDLEASLYAVNSKTGAYEARTVLLEVQYAVADSGNWVAVTTGTTLTNASTKPLRTQVAIPVASGQYDVRLRKLTANDTSTSAQNAVQWTQLKSFQQALTSYPGQSILAMTIKASGQISGAVDELNFVATAKPAPYWNGSAWVTATSRANGLSNPGVQILQLARGIFDENGKLVAGLGWADSRIDVEGLKRFMVWCTAKSLTFDAIIQEAMSHDDLLGAIAYAGLATVSWAEGRLGVQWLDNAAPVEGVINMGNIKAKSFSVAYDTNDRAEEIEYGYFDRAKSNSWNSLRVLAPGVSNPRSTARLSNMGITTEAHAALLARHAMAQNIYMAKSITFEQDLEFLTYRRGTVLALSHDLTQWGYSGRIQSATESAGVITLTLDDAIPATGPGGASSRYIGLRLVGETQYRVFTVAAFTGSVRSVQLVGAWPAGVALPGASSTGGQPLDALWIYDFKATPGQRVVVSKIEPSDNQGGARVTVVPLPDEFWPYVLTGAYTPPPNISLLSRVTSVSNLSVSEMLKRQGNTYYTELTVSFSASDNAAKVQVYGGANGGPLQLLGTTESRQFTWVGGLSETWSLELRPFNALGQLGGKQSLSYTLQGLTIPPADVVGLSLAIEGAGVRISWQAAEDVDYAETVVKIGNNWDTAQLIAKKSASSHLLAWQPVGLLQVWAAHVDTSGNLSATPASVSLTIARPSVLGGLAVGLGNSGLLVSWTAPTASTTQQPVDRVELSWSVNFASIVHATSATSFQLPFLTPGAKQLFARAIDVAGNVSDLVNVSFTVASPAAPTNLALAIGNTGVTASWKAPAISATQQPLAGVELSWFANFTNVLEARSATSAELGWLAAGTYTLYARYTDVAGNSGSAASTTFTVAVPSAPVGLALAFGNSSLEAKWQPGTVGANQQPLDRVELSWGSAFTSVVDGKKSTTTTFGWLAAGAYTLYARYMDMAGNVGAVSQTVLEVQAPAQPGMTAVETQINAVTLRWQDSKTSQPIRKYAIYYGEAGTSIASAALYGSAGADSRSDVLFFRSSGAKVAYLVAEDVAGNLSAARQIDVSITMPNDFVLATEYYEDWQSAELTNGTVVGGSTGQIILPAVDGRTWGQRLSNSGWTTPQQKIDAGYPIVVQPVPFSGKHVEQKDLGKVLPTGVVRVTPTVQMSVAGYVATIRIRGSVGSSSTVWQPWLVGDSASITDFRYLEVEYGVTSDGKGFVVLDDLAIKVEITEVSESASLVLVAGDAAGTAYLCNKTFLDIRTAQATPLGSPNIARMNCIVDDSLQPARVYVQAWDTANNRTSGTVSLSISGV